MYCKINPRRKHNLSMFGKLIFFSHFMFLFLVTLSTIFKLRGVENDNL